MHLDPATGKTKILASSTTTRGSAARADLRSDGCATTSLFIFNRNATDFRTFTPFRLTAAQPKQLTSGKFEVSDVRFSEDKTKFYFTSSEGSFCERHLYSMSFDGGARPSDHDAGNNQATVSPDETTLAIVRSFANKPPELYIAPNKTDVTEAEIKQVTNSPTDEW